MNYAAPGNEKAPLLCVWIPQISLHREVFAEAERLQMDYLNSITLESLLPTPLDLSMFKA